MSAPTDEHQISNLKPKHIILEGSIHNYTFRLINSLF